MQQYEEFISAKSKMSESHGFDIDTGMLNKHLFDFQRDIVKWALAKGKAAIFADCGLGKTLMQLSWAISISSLYGFTTHEIQGRCYRNERLSW